MAAYLAEFAPNLPIKALADLMAFNEKNRDRVMPHFAQEHMMRAAAKAGWTARNISMRSPTT